MSTFSANTASQEKWDTWVLRFWRDTAAITLFIVAPVLQIALTRWLPLAVFLALIFVLLGHAMTKFRHISSTFPDKSVYVSNWSSGTKLLVFSYLGFLSWMFLSLFWSPLPIEGARDVILLMVAPPIALFLAYECSRTKLLSFSTILVIGIGVTAILLIFELGGHTQFHKLGSDRNGLHDLNRNAVLLALFLAPLAIAFRSRAINVAWWILVVAGCLVAIYLSQSEAAKLMVVMFGLVWIAVFLLPRLHAFVFLGMGIIIVAFPLMLNPIDRLFGELLGRPYTVTSFLSKFYEAQSNLIEAKKQITPLKHQEVQDNRQLKRENLSEAERNEIRTRKVERADLLRQIRLEIKQVEFDFERAALELAHALPFGFATARLPI